MKSLLTLFVLSLLISVSQACEEHEHASAELNQILKQDDPAAETTEIVSDQTVVTKSATAKSPGAGSLDESAAPISPEEHAYETAPTDLDSEQ